MVSELEKARQQISQAKQKVVEQKEQLIKRREEAEKVKVQLSKQEGKLPTYSQKRLRAGLYSGLEGRKRRRIISDVKKEIGQKKVGIDIYKRELKKFEEEKLKPFESEISSREAEVSAYQSEVDSLNLAKKVFYQNKSVMILQGNKKAQEYYRQLLAGRDAAIAYEIKNLPTTPETKLPNIPIIKTPHVSFSAPRNLGRTDIIKDFRPLLTGFTISPNKGIKSLGLPILKFSERAAQTGGFVSVNDPYVVHSLPPIKVSSPDLSPVKIEIIPNSFRIKSPQVNASLNYKNLNLSSSSSKMNKNISLSRNVSNSKFLTTGSPKRFTPLLKLKPSRPPTPSKPKVNKIPIKKSSIKKIKTKEKENLFFGKSKKKKKKNNLWEF